MATWLPTHNIEANGDNGVIKLMLNFRRSRTIWFTYGNLITKIMIHDGVIMEGENSDPRSLRNRKTTLKHLNITNMDMV